jgi:hypothetical protein
MINENDEIGNRKGACCGKPVVSEVSCQPQDWQDVLEAEYQEMIDDFLAGTGRM